MDRKPLVLDDNAQIQRLQSTDGLDIPLESRVQELQTKFDALVEWMVRQGFELPPELTDGL
jgi:hypothetical protein